jgi:hypothetical protein
MVGEDFDEDERELAGAYGDSYVMKLREQRRRQREFQAARKQHLESLMGSDNRFDWEAPQPLADYDAQLGEHAAQLRNAARYLMGKVLDDDNARAVQAASAVARLIGTNLAIFKALNTANAAKSKTVRGVSPANDHQDVEQQG